MYEGSRWQDLSSRLDNRNTAPIGFGGQPVSMQRCTQPAGEVEGLRVGDLMFILCLSDTAQYGLCILFDIRLSDWTKHIYMYIYMCKAR